MIQIIILFLAETVLLVNPLADEYQIRFLKEECHKVMLKMLRTGCVLIVQLKIYSQTLTYPDLEKARVESLKKLKSNTLENLKKEADYIGLNDKYPILEERIRLFEKTINTFLSDKCLK